VGYTLDEIPNDITGETMASFEPTLDYCVVKIPRWTFEKFPETPDVLTTAMKSVGETMSIGRTFKEACKGAAVPGDRPLRFWRRRQGSRPEDDGAPPTRDEIEQKLATPNSQRIFYLRHAFQAGMSIEDISMNSPASIPGFCTSCSRSWSRTSEAAHGRPAEGRSALDRRTN
jgi:carbamoyl-phosphate synthase large subunit